MTFKVQGKMITVHPREIAVNALRDEEEAEKILAWVKREINEAWERRTEIEPSYEGAPKPKLLEILKLLPKINCRQYGTPTCIVFAANVAEGVKGPKDCPPLAENQGRRLENYVRQFHLED